MLTVFLVQSGRIDPNGNYTAPANPTIDTVAAVSLADPNASGTAPVTIQARP